MQLERAELKKIIEGALFAAGEPLSVRQLAKIFDEENSIENNEIKDILNEITRECKGRGIELKEVANGFRFQVPAELAPWMSKLWEERPPRYSRALLETLALIAYKQPVTRAEIEAVRGVAVSTNIIRTLMEREWVKISGHKEVPGRPALFATTNRFLDYFNLKSIRELPVLEDIADLEEAAVQLELSLEEDAKAEFAAEKERDTASGE